MDRFAVPLDNQVTPHRCAVRHDNSKDNDMATTKIHGDIDTTFITAQRDMFTSGLMAEIGPSAFATWHAIKWHADFTTGESYPGIRRLAKLTGLSTPTVQTTLKTLVANHLLRIRKRGQKNVYLARERLDVKVGARVVAIVVVDYVPAEMRERLEMLKKAGDGNFDGKDVWAEVELLPGPGLTLDAKTGTFKTKMRADEVPTDAAAKPTAKEVRATLKQVADQMRKVPKK